MRQFYADLLAVFRAVDSAEIDLNPLLLQALIKAEDRRFYYHCGVDPIAIVRACVNLLVRKRLQGASTIEAQLFRTVTNRREITWQRKLREAAGSVLISLLRPKARIAAAYLKVAYLGYEQRGVEFAAAQLGIRLGDLSVTEACELVCRLKRPARHASANDGALRQRVAWLRSRLGPRYPIKHGQAGNAEVLPMVLRQGPKGPVTASNEEL